jgi:hypothetical protein
MDPDHIKSISRFINIIYSRTPSEEDIQNCILNLAPSTQCIDSSSSDEKLSTRDKALGWEMPRGLVQVMDLFECSSDSSGHVAPGARNLTMCLREYLDFIRESHLLLLDMLQVANGCEEAKTSIKTKLDIHEMDQNAEINVGKFIGKDERGNLSINFRRSRLAAQAMKIVQSQDANISTQEIFLEAMWSCRSDIESADTSAMEAAFDSTSMDIRESDPKLHQGIMNTCAKITGTDLPGTASNGVNVDT